MTRKIHKHFRLDDPDPQLRDNITLAHEILDSALVSLQSLQIHDRYKREHELILSSSIEGIEKEELKEWNHYAEDIRQEIQDAAEDLYVALIGLEPNYDTELTYAKVNGPPEDWCRLQVIDLDTEQVIPNVVEVNTAEGWLRQYTHEQKWPFSSNVKLIKGRFRIERVKSP